MPCGKLTALKEDEPDAIEGLENIGKVGEDIEAVRKKAHAEHQLSFLSHSAKEVAFALLTQIPSVPALARVFGKLIPMMVGVEKR